MTAAWIDLRRHCGQVVKIAVRCEHCGHQALIAVPTRGSRLPKLVCHECGEADPLVEYRR